MNCFYPLLSYGHIESAINIYTIQYILLIKLHFYSGRKRNLYTSKITKNIFGETGYKVSYSFVLAIGGRSIVLRMCYVHTMKLQCIGVPTFIIHAACKDNGTKLDL